MLDDGMKKDDGMKQNQCSDRVMNQTWMGRALDCPPVSVGGRNNHAVVELTYAAFPGFDLSYVVSARNCLRVSEGSERMVSSAFTSAVRMIPCLSTTYRAGIGSRYSDSSWNLSNALPNYL